MLVHTRHIQALQLLGALEASPLRASAASFASSVASESSAWRWALRSLRRSELRRVDRAGAVIMKGRVKGKACIWRQPRMLSFLVPLKKGSRRAFVLDQGTHTHATRAHKHTHAHKHGLFLEFSPPMAVQNAFAPLSESALIKSSGRDGRLCCMGFLPQQRPPP